MKKRALYFIVIIGTFAIFFVNTASAYWVWTPETKKFINPKYAVKDSPKEQFDWAMTFFEAKDYQRAANEFDKLTKQYEFSEYAAKAQYYAGLSYENLGKHYIAFQNYQKAIENFPHIDNIDEILEREYSIGNFYMEKAGPKLMGSDILTSLDRASEIYKKIVDNAPFGKFAAEAQFKLGQALKKSDKYEEAIQAFQKVIDDYPTSKFLEQARYEMAVCAYKASLKPAYDVESTDKAIKTFEKFIEANKDQGLGKEADETVKRLKDNVAEKSFTTAQFYEKQKKYDGAIVYYQDVIDRFSESSFAAEAKARIEVLQQKKTR